MLEDATGLRVGKTIRDEGPSGDDWPCFLARRQWRLPRRQDGFNLKWLSFFLIKQFEIKSWEIRGVLRDPNVNRVKGEINFPKVEFKVFNSI